MGFLDKFLDKEKTQNLVIGNPRDLFNKMLKQTSGSNYIRELKYNIFYQIIAFKGVAEGVGCSTIVANTALALANLGLTVCVIDTSIRHPVQDVLLKTDFDSKDIEDRLDWFDMPYTRVSPLNISKLNKNISVLSFKGKKRGGVVDSLSTNDSSSLVDLAFAELHNKFDLILVDSCDELTSINTAALQQSQQVIQVWNDTPTYVDNIDNFITDCVTLSCPLDKMRYVVYSKINKDVMGSMDSLLAQYRLKKLATNYLSESCSLVLVTGKPLWQYASTDKSIEDFTNCIIDIVCHICNLDTLDDKAKGTITSNDIMEGKVDGTLTKKMLEETEGYPDIDRDPIGNFEVEEDD